MSGSENERLGRDASGGAVPLRAPEEVRRGDAPFAEEPEARSAEPLDDEAAPVVAQSRLPALPGDKPAPRRGLWASFLLFVVLPAAAVSIYYFGFASRQYVAEFRFAVTEASPQLPSMSPTSTSTPGGSAAAALGPIANAFMGSAGAAMQNYVVIDYLLSRQAVDELEKRAKVRAMYGGAASGADWWARFDQTQSAERFVEYWNRMVTAVYDPMTGLAVVKVRAFTPTDALTIAETMVDLAEDLVNTIARRPQLDAVRFAEGELKRAEDRMKQVRAALDEFRVSTSMIDPGGTIATKLELLKALRAQLVTLETELRTLGSQQQNPNAPAAQLLRSRLDATREQLAKVEREVVQGRDGPRVLSDVVAQYEQLDLDRQYTQAILVAKMQTLDNARANAAAQHLYLTPYVRPALPESAAYPKRIQSTVVASLVFLGLWLTGLMIARSAREHL